MNARKSVAKQTKTSIAVKIAKKSVAENKKAFRVKVVSSRTVYRAPVFYVTSEQVVEREGGKAVRRDIVHHPGSVVVMALDETEREPRVLLARQFRYAAGEELWEFPAGRIDEGEEALAAARRELTEETGFSAQEWKLALFFYSSPGFLDETMAVFLARGLKRGKATPEEDEFISKRFYSLSQAVKLVISGKVRDAKTIAGVLWLNQYFLRK